MRFCFVLFSVTQPQLDEATLFAMQRQVAQQTAFAQIPDVVRRVRLDPFDKLHIHAQLTFTEIVHRAVPHVCDQQ